MTPPPLPSILTPPTAAQTRAYAVSVLVSLGIPANAWRAGGLASSLLTATSSLFAAVVAQLVSSSAAAPFITICPVALLPYVAWYVYGIAVVQATYASGLVSLTNPGGGTYNVASGQLVVANSFTGVTYVNTAPFTLGPLTTLVGVPVQAQVLGSVGNANPGPGVGSIDTVVSTQLFAGTTVTVTNPAALAGIDAQSASDIIDACLAAIAAKSYLGPDGAYDYAVYTAVNSSGNPVNINRHTVDNDPDTGEVTIWCASPSGLPIQDDLNAVNAQAIAYAQTQGVSGGGAGGSFAVACSPVPLSATPQTITIWASGAGGAMTPAALLALATAALLAGLQKYPISGRKLAGQTQGYLFASYVNSQLSSASPLIFDVQGFDEDLPLDDGEVAQLTSNTTIVVRQVP